MHRGPCGKYKSNVSEEVLLSTIHICHNLAERTFPFLEFEREVLDVDLQQRMFWSSPFRPARTRTAPVASCKAAASPGLRTLAQGFGLAGIGLGRSSHVHGWHAAAAAGYGSGEATR